MTPDTAFDLVRARAETPGCKNVLHFNNAGASLMPACVLEAVKGYLDLEAAVGGHAAHAREEDKVERVYAAAALLLNADANEIAVVENATRAWDMAFYALARTFKPGDRILTGEMEFGSNYLAFLHMAKNAGVTVEAVRGDHTGAISIEALEDSLDERVRLIAVTHVPSTGGLVNPAAAIGRVARSNGIPYLLDACQSVGQMPVDVEEIGCDFLSATSRKFLRGPRGMGFLYVRADWIEKMDPPFIDQHAAAWTAVDTFEVRADARRFESFETSFAGKAGFGVAIDYALDWGLENIQHRIRGLAAKLRDGLGDIPEVRVHDQGIEQCGIVTFTKDGVASDFIKGVLARRDINVSVSPVEYARLDMERRALPPMVRASLHYYNDEEEIQRFLDAVGDIS